MQTSTVSEVPKPLILHMDDEVGARLPLEGNLEPKYEYIGTDSRMRVMGVLWDRRRDLALILVDQNMSPEKGSEIIPKIIETLEKLKRIDPAAYARRPPVVLCSSEDDSTLANLVRMCGADGYLSKGLLSGSDERIELFYRRIDEYAQGGDKKSA